MEEIIQALYTGERGLASKRMFGGVSYLVGGNMAFVIYQDNLISRLGFPEQAQQEVAIIYISWIDFEFSSKVLSEG